MTARIKDGRVTGVTVAIKHTLDMLEKKSIISRPEREKMLEDMYSELKLMPALQGEPLLDAMRQVGYLFG